MRFFKIYYYFKKNDGKLTDLPNILKENDNIIDRKLNVALTRAKKQLYIIGNEDLLKKNAIYRELIEHIQFRQNIR
jgi:DNA replication ATP-dependent helicase Dna2